MNKINLRYFLFSTLLTLIYTPSGIGQTNHLNKKITIQLTQVTLSTAFEEISKIGNINFSYNAKSINRNKLVTINAQKISIAKVLEELVGKHVQYKVYGNHIVLIQKKEINTEKKKLTYISFSGIVKEADRGLPLPSVSVYNLTDRSSATTHEDGSYSLRMPSGDQLVALTFSKRGFFDTIVFVNALHDGIINLSLRPEMVTTGKLVLKETKLPTENFSELKLVNNLISAEALVNAENLQVYEKRSAQISFLPYMGSNAKVSGTVTNNVSLNVLAGFTGAVNGLEVGTLLNIVKREVNGVQACGFGNIVGNYSKGVQLAGFFNKTTGTIKGMQIAGFSNIVRDTVIGVQVAGFTNILRGRMNGIQLSGFNNYTTENVDGVQATGFLNIARKDVKAAQLAGFMNISTGSNKGAQVAGFINYTRGSNKGAQVSGFLNIADTVRGVQLGVVNICDTLQGVSLGLFNYVRKGYRSIEVAANEIFYTNLKYRTGTFRFYNIITLSANPGDGIPRALGFGFGTHFWYYKKLSMALELTTNDVYEEESWKRNGINLLNKLSTTMNLRLAKHINLTAGPTLNVHVSSMKDSASDTFTSEIINNPFYENKGKNTNVQMSIGVSVGVRF